MPLVGAVHESVPGTFRTYRNVRSESGMRTKADTGPANLNWVRTI
jgi:hypothetical protein